MSNLIRVIPVVTYQNLVTFAEVYNIIRRENPQAPDWQVADVSNQITDLNDCLLTGRQIFLILEKYPKGNLDKGYHYYSLYYINKNYDVIRVWGYDSLYKYIGQISQNRDNSIPKYLFGSNAIGMSRIADSFDKFFEIYAHLTGTKVKFDR